MTKHGQNFGLAVGRLAVQVAAVGWWMAWAAAGAEFHVATHGHDLNPGTDVKPFRTIQKAADQARAGDVVTVHQGIYRERVNPPRGGESDLRRIVYRASPGESVEIRGSERVQGWGRVRGDVWAVSLPNARFGAFNPFTNVIHGDWFGPRGRLHHTGAIYLNGDWLTEAPRPEMVVAARPAGLAKPKGQGTGALLETFWFAEVDETNTTIWAQFPGADPNRELVEVQVRPCVFYPDQPGRNFITVRGFTLRQAATPWAPPTAEQMALLGTHWSKGWVIESNVISHSVCAGVSLGKYGDRFDNTSTNSAEGYLQTIERAQAHPLPWTRDRIGHHQVRFNTISHCEQAGIVGSLGAAFSSVTDNVIHDIHVRRLFTGAEMAGIKFHGAIDTFIGRNRISRCVQGLWLDWMSQGTRVSANVFADNLERDLFSEVNHGPYLVDHNVFLSPVNLLDVSEGGAFVHNLFAGKIVSRPELKRATPYHPAHDTAVTGLAKTYGGDNRFYQNLFLGPAADAEDVEPAEDPKMAGGYGLWVYDFRPAALSTGGNLYGPGAWPYEREAAPPVIAGLKSSLVRRLDDSGDEIVLSLPILTNRVTTPVVTSEMLGRARVSGCAYEHPSGSPLRLDTDFFGQPRSAAAPVPGPFASPSRPIRLKIR